MSGCGGGDWFVSSYRTIDDGTLKQWRVSYQNQLRGWIIVPSELTACEVLVLVPMGGLNDPWEVEEEDEV